MKIRNWWRHNELAKHQLTVPSTALLKVLQLNPQTDGLAIDLGSGAGADTCALVNAGWNVLAIDQDRLSLEQLHVQYPVEALQTSCRRFEQLNIPEARLINASFSLPFCRPDSFNGMWATIQKSLQPGGYFSGHFFGLKDSWYGRPDMTFHDPEAIATLFNDFDILWLEETQRVGKTLNGGEKYWNVFHIAACKH